MIPLEEVGLSGPGQGVESHQYLPATHSSYGACAEAACASLLSEPPAREAFCQFRRCSWLPLAGSEVMPTGPRVPHLCPSEVLEEISKGPYSIKTLPKAMCSSLSLEFSGLHESRFQNRMRTMLWSRRAYPGHTETLTRKEGMTCPRSQANGYESQH